MLRAAQVRFERAFTDISRQLRWSFLPPLMIFFAGGFSGLTGIGERSSSRSISDFALVADAMSVEAVPRVRPDGEALSEAESKVLHTKMQTLGRIAFIAGLIFVALLNIVMFAGVEGLEQSQKAAVYANIYAMALAIPVVSVSGVILSQVMFATRARRLRAHSINTDEAERLVYSLG